MASLLSASDQQILGSVRNMAKEEHLHRGKSRLRAVRLAMRSLFAKQLLRVMAPEELEERIHTALDKAHQSNYLRKRRSSAKKSPTTRQRNRASNQSKSHRS